MTSVHPTSRAAGSGAHPWTAPRLLLSLIAGAILAGPAGAQRPSPVLATTASSRTELRVDYVEDSLANGLKVLYHVDRSSPIVAVNLWYNVGSKHEQPGRTGFAHLFEHMMFKGSQNVPDGQHFSLLEAAGGRAGYDINGTTANDRTNYFEIVPSNRLELALWLEADRMGTLLRTLTAEKLENQREVVKNERRQGMDNQPYGQVFEEATRMAFPPEHPYHHSVIGSMRDLSAASVEDVSRFFRTYYAPNNAVLVVAGDIDVQQARMLVRKHFDDVPRGPAPAPLADMDLPPLIGAERRTVLEERHAPAPGVFFMYRMPAGRDARPTVELLAGILGQGNSSRLYNSLVREKQLAAEVAAFNLGLSEGADILAVYALGKPGGSPDSLERALKAEIDGLRQGIRQDELDRVRAGARHEFVDGLQMLGGFGGRADRLAEGWTFYRDPNFVNTVLPRYDAVTVAELQRLAMERIVPMNRVTIVAIPTRQLPGVIVP